MLESFFSGGPILLAIMIALTTALKWPSWLNYLWALVAFVFGIIVYLVR